MKFLTKEELSEHHQTIIDGGLKSTQMQITFGVLDFTVGLGLQNSDSIDWALPIETGIHAELVYNYDDESGDYNIYNITVTHIGSVFYGMQIESGELEGLFGKDVKAALKQAIERHNESMKEYSPDGYPDPVGRG